MTDLIINIAALLVTLGILVTFHEFGHFWVARKCGVKVLRFSVGFGSPLYRWQKGETEYVISALPLGGYVKMLGEQDKDYDESESHLALDRKPVWKRAAIAAAGPLANFLLALVLYWLMFMTGVSGVAPVVGKVSADSAAALAGLEAGHEIVRVDEVETRTWQEVHVQMVNRLGESGTLSLMVKASPISLEQPVTIALNDWLIGDPDPDILGSLGIRPYRLDIPAEIGKLEPGARGEAAGLQPGDVMVAIDGEDLRGWRDWVEVVRANPEQALNIDVLRNGQPLTLTLRPEQRFDKDGSAYGFVGIEVAQPEQMPTFPVEMEREIRYSPLAALPQAVLETWDNIVFVVSSLKKIVMGLIAVENLAGPITIAQLAGTTATYGFEYFVGFLAVVSISLGVFNLLPVPVLDGGHLLFCAVEAVIRRPIPERIQEIGAQMGVLFLLALMALVFYNDLNRLFN